MLYYYIWMDWVKLVHVIVSRLFNKKKIIKRRNLLHFIIFIFLLLYI